MIVDHEKFEKILEGMRDNLAKARQLGLEIEKIIREQITKGRDESTLDEETRDYINETRRRVQDGIAEGERKINESEQAIAPLRKLLYDAKELKKRLDELEKRK